MGNKTRNSILIGTSRAHKRPQPADEVAAVSQDSDLIWWSPVGKRQLCVLVVADDPKTAKSLSMLVKAWGHEVWVAGDGAAALRIAAGFQTDVVLLDIAMPRMDGRQVARRLRRQARFKDTLLIALLGRADREHRLRAEKAGFDLCLVKPVEPSTLEVLLLLEQDRLARSSTAVPTPRKDTSRKSAAFETTPPGDFVAPHLIEGASKHRYRSCRVDRLACRRARAGVLHGLVCPVGEQRGNERANRSCEGKDAGATTVALRR
jgi:CheY-like chemotaxis protein